MNTHEQAPEPAEIGPDSESDNPVDEIAYQLMQHINGIAAAQGVTDPGEIAEITKYYESLLAGEAARIAMANSAIRFFKGRAHTDSYTETSVDRLRRGQEPPDVLFGETEAGSRKLDPDFASGAANIIFAHIQEETSAEDLARIAAECRRLLMFSPGDIPAGDISFVGLLPHIPAAEVLSGQHGENIMNEFASGATGMLESLVRSVLENRPGEAAADEES